MKDLHNQMIIIYRNSLEQEFPGQVDQKNAETTYQFSGQRLQTIEAHHGTSRLQPLNSKLLWFVHFFGWPAKNVRLNTDGGGKCKRFDSI